MKSRTFIVLATCIICSACGFEPMYGEGFSQSQINVQEELSQIAIENIPDWQGQYLRNELIDRFYLEERPANPRYLLKVSPIRESTYNLDITVTSDATRAQLTMNTSMNLIDKSTGEIVLRRSLKAISSYNILESKYATRMSEQNTRKNVLDDIARQIEQQIVLYLKN